MTVTARVSVKVMKTVKVMVKETECETKVYGTSTGLNVSERINNSSGSRSERNCNSESDRKGQQQ